MNAAAIKSPMSVNDEIILGILAKSFPFLKGSREIAKRKNFTIATIVFLTIAYGLATKPATPTFVALAAGLAVFVITMIIASIIWLVTLPALKAIEDRKIVLFKKLMDDPTYQPIHVTVKPRTLIEKIFYYLNGFSVRHGHDVNGKTYRFHYSDRLDEKFDAELFTIKRLLGSYYAAIEQSDLSLLKKNSSHL
jgi:hypothetical protein